MSDKQVRAQYTREFKLEAVRQVRAGQAIAVVVAKVLGIPKASLGNWVRLSSGELDDVGSADKATKSLARADGDCPAARRECSAFAWSATSQKSRGVLRAGHAARYAWIDQMKYRYPVSVSCGCWRSAPAGTSTGCAGGDGHGRSGPGRLYSDETLLAHIRAIHAEVKGEYGWPRMHKELVARGASGWAKTGLQAHAAARHQGQNETQFVVTTDSRHSLPVAPDLVQRRFNPEAPTSYGVATSPTSKPTKAGCTWPPSSTCLTARWWAGACSRTCRPAWSGCAGHGMVAAPAVSWADIPQRPGQPVLQCRVPASLERLGHVFIDEQEGQLLG